MVLKFFGGNINIGGMDKPVAETVTNTSFQRSPDVTKQTIAFL